MDDPTSDSLVDNRGGQSAEGSKPPNSVVWALDTQWDEASEARAHRAATASPPSNLGGIVGSRISPERISVSGKKPQRGRGERERCRGSVFARFFSSLLEGISGSRVDLTMDGLAAGFNCNTPTRAAFIFGGSFVLMLYISLLPSLEYWGYTGAGELPVGVSRPDAAILMKLAVQVLGAVCGASVFVMCCVPRWRPRAMRAQAPMGAVLFMCVVWNVVDNYFIIWWDRDFLTEWDAVVGTCITLSIPWAFLLNSNPRPMAKALQASLIARPCSPRQLAVPSVP